MKLSRTLFVPSYVLLFFDIIIKMKIDKNPENLKFSYLIIYRYLISNLSIPTLQMIAKSYLIIKQQIHLFNFQVT